MKHRIINTLAALGLLAAAAAAIAAAAFAALLISLDGIYAP